MKNKKIKTVNNKTLFGRSFIIALIFMSSLPGLFAEEASVDLNTYYKFPFSLGIEYQSYSYFNQDSGNNSSMGLTAQTRLPLPFFPELQPALDLGLVYTDNQNALYPQQWDHTQYYALTGLVYANRLLKNFEFGIEILGGTAYVVYPDLLKDQQAYGSSNLIGQAGLYISLVPNYNFMLAFHPNIKYYYSLSSVDRYNGLVMGIGLALQYRFGDDPDRPQAPLNSLVLEKVNIPSAYANMQYYYTRHPLGKIVVTNPEKYPVKNIEVHFSQAAYMDSKTYCGTKEMLAPGQSWETELYATFNDRIFELEGCRPMNGEIVITYKAQGRNGEQRKSVSFDLNDKTTVAWNDYNKAAALITPADSVLKNYSSYIQRQCAAEAVTDFNKNLQTAIQLYNALTELNIIYQPDPVQPFSSLESVKSGEKLANDTVYLPRDTLKRGSGDCDDLTVLFCSLLESLGIESGYIILPGHILPVFNTGEDARCYENLHPSREMSIQYDGKLWLPVETTLLGKADFPGAWRKGMEQYASSTGKGRLYITHKAWEVYKPVGLQERDLGLQYGEMVKIKKGFKADLTHVIDNVLAGYIKKSEEQPDKGIFNTIGSLYGNIGDFTKAEKAFRKALALDADYLYAKINLAILCIRKKEYNRALADLTKCGEEVSQSGNNPSLVLSRIYTYTSRCYQALGESIKAQKYTELGYEIEKQLVARHITNTAQEQQLNNDINEFCNFVMEEDL